MLKRKPKLTRQQSLNAYPVKNIAVREEIDDGGFVTLHIPRKSKWWVRLLMVFFYVPEERTVALDEVGSFVWKLCDGEHTVRDLIGELSSKYKLNRREAEVSLIAYLRTLGKKRLIAILAPAEEPNEKKKN